MRLTGYASFAIFWIAAGCYSTQDAASRGTDSSLVAAAAGGSARDSGAQTALTNPRKAPPSVTGSSGCAASDPAAGPGVDPANFPGEGGAAAWLATICGRCGWTAQTEACRKLVYSVPFIDNPAYSKCNGIELASCIETNSCVCDAGQIPKACEPVKARLDTCVREYGQ